MLSDGDPWAQRGGYSVKVREQIILVTGAAGLIGRAVSPVLRAAGAVVIPFDLRSEPARDVTDAVALRDALREVDGIIHLAAVSRVVDGERDPDRCRRTNVEATRALLRLALEQARVPWFIQASSREVYGQQERMPVPEDAPLSPRNVYAESKVAGEQLAGEARSRGMATAVVRFSNVFGDTLDHADRVVPAFAHAAALGRALRVDGSACTFDFTHVSDVADGLTRVVRLLCDGERTLPPIHFVAGRQTSLGELAALAMAHGAAARHEAPARSFDVHRFCGDPGRAEALLGWRAMMTLEQGFARLVADFRASAPAAALL
jgi:nucleoside-diphosphate-sugar epimerase